MSYLILKAFLTAIVVVAVSEIAKRSSLFGAVVASLPLTSLLAIIWLYLDTKNVETVSRLTVGILWLIAPSVIFFIALPIFLRLGWNFWISIGVTMVLTSASYLGFTTFITRFGVKL